MSSTITDIAAINELEAVFKLMKQYGVPELRIGELHVHMPQALLGQPPVQQETKGERLAVGVTLHEDGTIQTDPDFYAAAG